jgi:hypothetical protein
MTTGKKRTSCEKIISREQAVPGPTTNNYVSYLRVRSDFLKTGSNGFTEVPDKDRI